MKGPVLTGFVDIECALWDKPVVCVAYQPRDTKVFRTVPELVDYLRARGGFWWTWNGGRYDTLACADQLMNLGATCRCSMAGAAVSRLDCKNLHILDAYRLIPFSLEKAAELVGESAPRDLGWPCRCGEYAAQVAAGGKGCGGYCRITTRLPKPKWDQLAAYCVNDARLGYAIVAAVLERFTAAGMSVRGTIGQTAWTTAQAWAGIPDALWRTEVWKIVRRAYFGGRPIVVQPAASHGGHYDLASAYPAALATTELPMGKPSQGFGRRATLGYLRGHPGVYQARVTVDDSCFLPPLPVRDERGRIYYPIGSFAGWWTGIELRAAEQRGARIDQILECVAWTDPPARVLEPVVRRWWAERTAAGKDTRWGELWREVSVALTGKLAQSPDMEEVKINPGHIVYCDPDSDDAKKWGCTRKRCTRKCKAWRQLDRDGRVFARHFWDLRASAHTHWAAHLTAVTRMRVLDGWRACGDDLVYGQTDSAWSTGRPPGPLGAELGDWAFKHGWADWECRGVNLYRYVSGDGEVIVRAGGFDHLTDRQWRALGQRDQELVSSRGVLSLRQAAPSQKLFKRRSVAAKIVPAEGWYGDRKLDLRGGRTYPVRYGEAKAAREKRGQVPL